MTRIFLISCTSKKLKHSAKARDMYSASPRFRYMLEYAELLRPDKIFILSAKYGLLSLDEIIEPYNITLNMMTQKEIMGWSKHVLNSLERISDLKKDEFVFLAGNNYRKYIVSHLSIYKIPMEHVGLFYQSAWLKREILKLRNRNE
jgi:hypothetical protein